jgi:hypothetical protein
MQGSVEFEMAVSGSISTELELAAAVSGAVTAWVVNLTTGGHSAYSNFTFNSFFRLGDDYYGCHDTLGICKLTGETDNGTAIEWEVVTPVTTFGKRNRKYVYDARVIMRANSDVNLKEIVDEQLSVDNLIAVDDGRNGIHARRIKLPKGVNGTAWQFELSGNGPADISSLDVEPLTSQRT